MLVHWNDPALILPLRYRDGGNLLQIPANCQKSHKSETIPTTPEFGALLDEVPNEQRDGWIFNPAPLRDKWLGRLTSDQVGRIISDIGEEAGIVVKEASAPDGTGKYASAQDLRRSFGQRMADAGLPPHDLQSIMRHSPITTTKKYYLRHRAGEQAKCIAEILTTNQGTPAKSDAQKETAKTAVTPSEA